jgi:signal transduction histidine kinase
VLTFVILAGFAAIVGVLTTRQVRGQFNGEMDAAVAQLATSERFVYQNGQLACRSFALTENASVERAQIRIYNVNDKLMCPLGSTADGRPALPKPNFAVLPTEPVSKQFGYRVETREITWSGFDGFLLYARPLSDVDHTLARVRFFLILGVLGGTVLALLAGLALAGRAMRPVAELTDAAREIERTRDPRRRIPHPEADDEVAELARTLEDMLHALDSARSDTEAALDRQREFVADASHELRTPLTAVLANLELLAEELNGEQAQTAQAALRSTRRMRRLVGDLLLLARADAERVQPRRATALSEVLVEAAAELEPVSDDHELSVDARPVVVDGVRDELHRLALNLLENGLRHTPAGTHIHASTSAVGDEAVLTVEDDGPGIPPELEVRVFDRFVRAGRDGGRGSGLGLAIVRAVAESHGGTVSLERPAGRGVRFVVRLPLRSAARADAARVPADDGATVDLSRDGDSDGAGNGDHRAPVAHTSTTTGSTIGRRRRRS